MCNARRFLKFLIVKYAQLKKQKFKYSKCLDYDEDGDAIVVRTDDEFELFMSALQEFAADGQVMRIRLSTILIFKLVFTRERFLRF